MNKRKKVAIHKHRVKAKKRKLRQKEQSTQPPQNRPTS